MQERSAFSLSQGDALVIVDVQTDFLPGGALPVAQGDEVIPLINLISREFQSRKLPIFATRDWHPPDHCSFLARGGSWPPHCVQGTPGAHFAAGLELPEGIKVISKGFDRDQEAYSGFQGTEFLKELNQAQIKRLTVVGLATDYCVLNTVRDALGFGFRVQVIQDAIRAVNAKLGDEKRAIQEMKNLGARFMPSFQVSLKGKSAMSNIVPYVHRKVVVLHESETSENAAKAMSLHGIGSVFVSNHKSHLVGVVTDRDLACRVLAEERPRNTPLSKIMTRDPARVEESASVENVIQIMQTRGIRRVPVIRRMGAGRERCVGLVSLDDLIASRDIDDYHLMRVVRSQVMRRIKASKALQEPAQVHRNVTSLRRAMALATQLPEETAARVLSIVIAGLVGRLHHTATMYLGATLPKELREEILATPAGPDPGISAHSIVSKVMTELDLSESVAHSSVYRTCRALEGWVGLDRFDHIKSQLPQDLKALFGLEEGDSRTRKAAA